MLKAAINNVLNRYFPSASSAVRALRARRNFRGAFSTRQIQIKTLVYGDSDPVVLAGPFAGMKYLNEVVWGPIEPKWLGTYEQELHPVVERILQTNYSSIIDVGSAEGYYAVGLATRLPRARLYSYDVDPWARGQQRKLARLNGVNNLEISGRCTGHELTDRISGRALLICDIEGYEYDLLNPNQTPALRRCDILVELHDRRECFTPRSGADELSRRFLGSHSNTAFAVGPRTGSVLAASLRAKLTAQEIADCMDEKRSPAQLWLWLEAREYQRS